MKRLIGQSGSPRIAGEAGAIHTIPLFLIVAAVGIVSYLLISSTAPFKGGLFGVLNPKPASHAAFTGFSNVIDMAYPCGFQNPAFCDNFSEGPATVKGRGNDLDFKRWSFARDSGNNSNTTSAMAAWVPIPETAHCKDVFTNVQAPLDSWFCGDEVPEPEHWMESFHDGGSFVDNDARIRQPFDFNNRTGLIQYGVDIKNMGSHGWWTETWIVDQPADLPHDSDGSGNSNIPRNGVGIVFSGSCSLPQGDNPAADGAGHTSVSGVTIMRDYVALQPNQSAGPYFQNEVGDTCITTTPDVANMIQIRLSSTRVEIWGSDAGSNVLKEMYAVNFKDPSGNTQPLPFTTGFVNFNHVAYNAEKAGALHYVTYHWHDMGFDGPVHPNPRAYEILDSLTPSGGNVNLGYMVQDTGINDGAKTFPAFTFNNVDLTGASTARLIFTSFGFGPGNHIQYQFNNGTWRTFAFPSGTIFEDPNFFWAGSLGHVIDIPLSDLVQGTNTLKLKTDASLGGTDTFQIMNTDLEVLPPDSTTTAPAVGMISCHLMDLMMFVMPSMQMTANDPCMGHPNVAITQPANNQIYAVPPATIPISVSASAVSPATSISKVVLSHGATTLATLTSAPYNFTWNNVQPGNYVITATVTDNQGQQRISQVNVTVNPPTPVISNVKVTNITSTGATITWTTDKPGDSQVDYGLVTNQESSYENSSALNSTQTTTHSVTISGLNAVTDYNFRVDSRNSFGLTQYKNQSFTSAAPAAGTGPFTGQYWNLPATPWPPTIPTTTPDLTRTDNSINFDWGGSSPDPKIHNDQFAVRWTGNINIPTTSNYIFVASTDDAVRLYIDGTLAIDQWSDGPKNGTVTLPLTAGSHAIIMEYYEGGVVANAKLGWQVNNLVSVNGWAFCANENQQCLFSGTMQVRFGAGTSFITGTFTNGVACTNSAFGGDPAQGQAKHCDINTGVTVTPTPTPSSTPVPTPTPSGSCPKASLGDVDCDGTIGIFDFNTLVTNFGKTGTGIAGDIDGSGKVDIFDFNTLVTNFGH